MKRREEIEKGRGKVPMTDRLRINTLMLLTMIVLVISTKSAYAQYADTYYNASYSNGYLTPSTRLRDRCLALAVTVTHTITT